MWPHISAWSQISNQCTCNEQVGHAGTLDPLATGLLIVCTGQATKVVDTFQAMHKSYSGMLLIDGHAGYKSPSNAWHRHAWHNIAVSVHASRV